MLKIRPNCEACNKDLPANSTQAYICSYECTFCEDCVNKVLSNVCPNCGGDFCQRPIRPTDERREGVSLTQHPASTNRVHTKYSHAELLAFAQITKGIKPEDR